MAAGLGLEPSHPVLETSALANILTRSVVFVFVCPKRQASFRFVSENMWYRGIPGRGRGIRTLTGWILSPLSLPVGIHPHKVRLKTRIFTEDTASNRSSLIAYWGQGATLSLVRPIKPRQ